MKRILCVLCLLLFAATAFADTELNDRQREIVGEILNTLYQQSKEMEFLGADIEAARLKQHHDELSSVVFWREATGPIDTTMVAFGRWKSGQTDCAYQLPGAGNNLFLGDCFFQYHAPSDTPWGKLDRIEQASMLIHENIHLNRGGGEEEAYIEQYLWLRKLGVNRDKSVDWVTKFDGSKANCAVMDNVIEQLKKLGVSLDDLEKRIAAPPRLERTWAGSMIIEQTPYADDQLSQIPPAARKYIAMMFPSKGTAYKFTLNVERKGPNNSIGKILGVPGQGGTIEIEMLSRGPATEKVRARQLYKIDSPSEKKKDLQYTWDGWVEADQASGKWEAFLVGGNEQPKPCYSGTWAVQRTKN